MTKKSNTTSIPLATAAVPGQAPAHSRLTTRENLLYSQPIVGVGFMFFLLTVYLMKHTTDVLGMSPLVIGTIMLVSRIWDAASDPLVGFFSDKTRSSMGRRRPWIAGSALPIALTFLMIWNPPASLSGLNLTLWVGAGVLLFFTAMTGLTIPHYSLGAELSDAYHERTRTFGYRHFFNEIGSFLAVFALFFLFQTAEPKALIFDISLAAGLVTAGLIISMVWFTRERAEFQTKGEVNAFHSYRDVARNKHARLLISVFLLSAAGMTFAAVLTPYVSEYILGMPEAGSWFLLVYLSGSVIGVPMWVRLSARFGKRNLWLYGKLIIGTCLGSFIFLEEGSVWHMGLVLFMIGLGAGANGVVGPSIQSDVIDYGESLTGKRTEGAYFAAWNFTGKAATGITFMITGMVLEFSGFVPNIEQTEDTKMWILIGFSIIPLMFYYGAALLLSRFHMDEQEHARIQLVLQEKRAKIASPL